MPPNILFAISSEDASAMMERVGFPVFFILGCGVLILYFGKWAGPRLDKVIDSYMRRNEAMMVSTQEMVTKTTAIQGTNANSITEGNKILTKQTETLQEVSRTLLHLQERLPTPVCQFRPQGRHNDSR